MPRILTTAYIGDRIKEIVKNRCKRWKVEKTGDRDYSQDREI